MNCAAVTITNGGSGLASFPDIFVANIENGCGTEEGFDVYFPNPGASERVRNLSTSNKSPIGNCAPPLPPPPGGPPVPTLTPQGLIQESKVLSGTTDAIPPTPPTTPAPTPSPFSETPVKTTDISSSTSSCSPPPQAHCECRCGVPDTSAGYIVDISPFGF